jgi:Recombination endonuclease VII
MTRLPSKRTLKKYKLTSAEYLAIYDFQHGCCAICGISEAELEAASHPDELPANRVLHIDHEHGTSSIHVRGLLCFQCNFDLEAFIRNTPVTHPGRRGTSLPRNDPRFTLYLNRQRPKNVGTTTKNALLF